MVRLRVLLVTLILGACQQDLPLDIWVEDSATELEEAIIVSMIDEANRGYGEELLGHPVFTYQGRHRDPNGFSPEDFDDGMMVIYTLHEKSPYWQDAVDLKDGPYNHDSTVGYGTLSDGIIFRYRLPDDHKFATVTLHEMGHMLGMGHLPLDMKAVMYPRVNGVTMVSRADQKAFCGIYDCTVPE